MSQPIFVECGDCGERWKAATLPLDVKLLSKMLVHLHCPNCAADDSRIFISKSDRARNGRKPEEVKS